LKLHKVKILHNPKSGFIKRPQFIRKSVDRILANAAFHYDYFETQYKGHAHEMAVAAEAEGYDAVVAIGGDGTANEVASALLYKPVIMGLIPIGSGNGLARGLGIPVSVRRSANLLMEGCVRAIDAGSIAHRHFFVTSGMGFDALIGKLFDDHSLRGPLPYFYIGVREFFLYEAEVFTLKFDGRTIRIPALLVTIANTPQWGNSVTVAPNALPDDGLLDVCLIHRVNVFNALINLPKLFTGRIDKIRHYERYQTTAVQIIREKPGVFHVDGEPDETSQVVDVKVLPKALQIIVPC
jgi:diacylglycerol kinase (ATP)